MKISQYGSVGEIAEIRAIRTHANGRQERFQLYMAIAPDMVMSGGRLYPGAAMTARGDRLKLTDFEREYLEYCLNEGGVLSATTEKGAASASEPIFGFEVVTVGRRAISHHSSPVRPQRGAHLSRARSDH